MTELPSGATDFQREDPRAQMMRRMADVVDLRELLRKLWRQRWVIAGTTLLLTVATAIVLALVDPIYTAKSYVMIEPQEARVVDTQALLEGRSADTEAINSEITVMSSRRVAGSVVDDLRLTSDPEFNPALAPPSLWQRIGEEFFPTDASAGGNEGTVDPDRRRTIVVDGFLNNLNVENLDRSRILEVSFVSTDPQKAAEVVNAVVDAYIVSKLEAKSEAMELATGWLGERLRTLRQDLTAAERAVASYRQDHGLVQGQSEGNLAQQQLTEVNSELIRARAERAAAEARLQEVENVIASKGNLSAVAAVINSEIIRTLLVQEAELTRRAAELAQEYGPRHPNRLNVQAEISDLRTRISGEIDKVVQNLRSDAQVARAREAELRQEFDRLQQQAGSMGTEGVELMALEREAEATRALYENFLKRYQELSGQQEILTPDAKVVSYAEVPLAPSFPKFDLMIGLTIFLSAMLGILIAFLIEQLDSGFRSADQIEDFTGEAGLGLVPEIGGAWGKDTKPWHAIVKEPISAYSEAIRNLIVGLGFANLGRLPRTVVITSAIPGEGKSTVALSMARSAAMSGKKVLLVDCDLRRATVHEMIGVSREPGLVEVLTKHMPAKDTIRRDEQTGADILTAGQRIPNSQNIIGSDAMGELLVELSKTYDMIVLDTAPILAVTDTRILANLSERVVFVVRWERTKRETVVHGLKAVRESGGHLAGAVLSMVDVRKNAHYGYSDSGQYYGSYAKYYTT